MTKQLQILLIIVTVLVFVFIIHYIRKSRISSDMASIWILWGLGLILISIFPSIVSFMSHILGIQAPINTIFLIMIFLLYILVFYLYLKISLLENRVKNLIQRYSLDNKEKENKNDE